MMAAQVVPGALSARQRRCHRADGHAKRAYDSRGDALLAMRRQQTMSGASGLNVYRCCRCGFHHIGHAR